MKNGERKLLAALRREMSDCAERLEYEKAAVLRDEIAEIEKRWGK